MKPHGWLWPLSIPYQAVVQTRNRLFDIGVLTSHNVEASVISVGNISVGGTGKTPFVIHILDRLDQLSGSRKVKTAVISRGYKGTGTGTQIVSEGKHVRGTPELMGDEPVLIAESSKRTVVITDKNRLRGANVAISAYKTGIIVLDDAFQHRKVSRDVDIVLLDGRNPLGNRRVLPAGFLREPVSSLARADLIVLSKCTGSDEELKDKVDKLSDLMKKPVIATRVIPRFWHRVNQGEIQAADQIAGKKVLAFAGIAKPDSFFNTVEELGGEITAEIPLPDHCKYEKKYLDHISRQFVKTRSEWLVTTAKDAVKLPYILKLLPAYYLDIGIEVAVGSEILDEKLKKVLKERQTIKTANSSAK
ncbi:MAG: tetraacyldisaccharide 4'-kinase [Calditrichaeota bacterium]|jgi:tetraacyldisaccharide 4'-kinase|nr:tetraacyldisaccharide 4'-kinase [Calditrichota bacterium]